MADIQTLVLLPGLDGTDVFLRPLAAELRPPVRPLIVQYPNGAAQTREHLLAGIREATRELSTYYLLGWSFGGPLALQLAEEERERVRGLILVSTFLRAPHPLHRPLRFAIRSPVTWLWRFARRAPTWLRPAGDPWRVAKAETWARVSARTIAARLRLAGSVDARAALAAFDGPVLCLSADRDRVVPPRHADEICSLARCAHRVVLPARHFALYTHAPLAARAIVDFIAQTNRRIHAYPRAEARGLPVPVGPDPPW